MNLAIIQFGRMPDLSATASYVAFVGSTWLWLMEMFFGSGSEELTFCDFRSILTVFASAIFQESRGLQKSKQSQRYSSSNQTTKIRVV